MKSIISAALGMLLTSAFPAAAQNVTWSFNGQAQLTAANLGSTSFTGTLTWNLSTPATRCIANTCYYNLTDGSFLIDGHSYGLNTRLGDPSSIAITNSDSGDSIFVGFLLPNPPNNLVPYTGGRIIISGPPTMLSSTALPANTSFASFITEGRVEFDSYGFPDDIGYLAITAPTFQGLIGLVQVLNLDQGVSNSLDKKLQNAIDAYYAARAGNVAGACGLLGAFINEVTAVTGLRLSVTEAAKLTAFADQLRTSIGCK